MKFSKELLHVLACENIAIIDWEDNKVKYDGNKVDFQYDVKNQSLIKSIEGRDMLITIYDEKTLIIGLY